MDKNQVQALMNCSVSENLNIENFLTDNKNVFEFTAADIVNITTIDDTNDDTKNQNLSCWHYWQDYYYPQVIYHEYPIYIRERAQDKARQAYEIIKILKDKKLANIEKVSDFIDLMDTLIKVL